MAHAEYKFDKFIGLYSSVNAFSRAPQGAFKILDNVMVTQPGIIEPRRGFSALVASAAPATINSIFSFLPGSVIPGGVPTQPANSLTTILGHSPGTGSFFSLQNGAFAQSPLLFGNGYWQNTITPYINARSRFVQYGFNAYATSSIGLWKSETGTSWFHTVLPTQSAGFSSGLVYTGAGGSNYGITGSLNGIGGGAPWLPTNFTVSYKTVIIRKNLNDNTIVSGPPSDSITVANITGVLGYLGATAYVTLAINNSLFLQPTDVIQIYRTKSAPINAQGPDASNNTDYYLVQEISPVTSSPIQNYLHPETGNMFNVSLISTPVWTVGYVDVTPDAALYFPLYTNPDDGGGSQITTQTPPAGADIALYKGVMYMGNTADCHNFTITITGTGTGGGQALAVGASITIDGYTYTFVTDPNPQLFLTAGFPNNVPLFTAGVATANINYTTRALGTAINLRYAQLISNGLILPQGALVAQYLPNSSSLGGPGSLYVTRLIPGNFPFNASSSSPNGWGNNFTSAGTSDNNTQVAGLRFSPLNQPDVWPLENEEVIGSEGVSLLRIISTRDGMWIFKDTPDGLFLFTDSGGNTNLSSFDPTVSLLAPDACCVMDNDVYALCVDGVQLIDQQGKQNISIPIQRDLLALVQQVGPANIFTTAWMYSYESEKCVVLALPASPIATEASIFYVFNKNTQAWYTHSFPQANIAHGVVDLVVNQVVMSTHTPASPVTSQAFQLWLERKNFNPTDHQDLSFTIACPTNQITNIMTFPTSYHGIGIGDLVSQIQGSLQLIQRVAGLGTTIVYNDTIILDSAASIAWASGGALLTVQKGIASTLQLLPIVGDSELIAKQFSDQIRLYFRYLDSEFYGSNVWTDEQPVTDAGQNGVVAIAQAWDTNQPWGSGVWGAQQAYNVLSRVTFAKTYVRAAELDLLLTFNNAATRWELEGITVGASGGLSDRVVRGSQGGFAAEGPSPTLPSPAILFSVLTGGPAASQIAQGAPLGLSAPAALVTDQGAAVTCTRSTPGMCLNSAGAPVLLGPNLSRVEPTGLLCEGSTTNLIVGSQLAGGPGWNLFGNGGAAAPTITLNTTDLLAPDGTQTASKMVIPACTTTQASTIYETVTLGQTRSVWLRTLSGVTQIQLSASNSVANSAITCTVTPQWQRFVFTYATSLLFMSIGYDGSETGNSFSGAGTTVYVWGAQAENYPFATSYFPTNTNIQVDSAMATGAVWATSGCNVVLNSGLAPDGNTSAAVITTIPHNNSTFTKFTSGTAFSVVTGQIYTFSVYAKAGPAPSATGFTIGDTSNFIANFDVINQLHYTGTSNINDSANLISTSVVKLANGWARYTATFTSLITGSPQNSMQIWESGFTNYATIGGYGISFWGMQVENGSAASQFFLTGATLTSTRAQDLNFVPLTLPGPTPFTMSCTGTPLSTWPNITTVGPQDSGVLMFWSDAVSFVAAEIGLNETQPHATFAGVIIGDSAVAVVNNPTIITDSLPHRAATQWSGGGVGGVLSAYLDGVLYGTGTLGGTRNGAATELGLGWAPNDGTNFPLYGWLTNMKITVP